MRDQVLSYREMCDAENVQTLQRGMNYRMNAAYSVILMSQRRSAPYHDRILADGRTVEYEGHDEPRTSPDVNPKHSNQPRFTKEGRMTQNGLFCDAVSKYKAGTARAEPVKVYEKILPGVWSFKGLFDLVDYRVQSDGRRSVFRFVLRLSQQGAAAGEPAAAPEHNRLIPSEVKKEVWKRDGGKCGLCGSTINLHFDHDVPFSKGGASIAASNIRLLCAAHNLAKGNKIQ